MTICGINQCAGRVDTNWEILALNDPRASDSGNNELLGTYGHYPQDFSEPVPSSWDSAEDFPYSDLPEPTSEVPSYAELLLDWREQEHLKHLWIDYNVFQIPCSWHESQDIVMPNDSFMKTVGGNCFRTAVSSGVVKSFHPADYAGILTRIFTEIGDRVFNDVRLLLAAGEWGLVQEDAIMHNFPNSPEQQEFEIRYVNHNSASATLNGVEFNFSSMRYKSSSIGDTVFFEVRRERTDSDSRPESSMTAEDFPTCPKHLSTETNDGKYIDTNDVSVRSGSIKYEHFYLICSAPLARFLLQEDEDFPQSEKLSELLSITNDDEFRRICLEQRMKGRMVDDDTTLVRIWFTRDAEV